MALIPFVCDWLVIGSLSFKNAWTGLFGTPVFMGNLSDIILSSINRLDLPTFQRIWIGWKMDDFGCNLSGRENSDMSQLNYQACILSSWQTKWAFLRVVWLFYSLLSPVVFALTFWTYDRSSFTIMKKNLLTITALKTCINLYYHHAGNNIVLQ